MSDKKYPSHLKKLIATLRTLPGVGTKTAERYAFALLKKDHDELAQMAQLVASLPQSLTHCKECGALIDIGECPFCSLQLRSGDSIMVVASAQDIFSIEHTGRYSGLYHVLGSLLSPLQGKGPEDLSLHLLRKRIERHRVSEVIIALDSTVEGDATALFLKQELQSYSLEVSRFAFGLPMGSPLEFVDDITLTRALESRLQF